MPVIGRGVQVPSTLARGMYPAPRAFSTEPARRLLPTSARLSELVPLSLLPDEAPALGGGRRTPAGRKPSRPLQLMSVQNLHPLAPNACRSPAEGASTVTDVFKEINPSPGFLAANYRSLAWTPRPTTARPAPSPPSSGPDASWRLAETQTFKALGWMAGHDHRLHPTRAGYALRATGDRPTGASARMDARHRLMLPVRRAEWLFTSPSLSLCCCSATRHRPGAPWRPCPPSPERSWAS